MLEEDIFTQRERTKIEGFGKPLDLDAVGGGSVDWFQCKGMPFGSWEKPSEWYACGDDADPVYIAQRKAMFRKKRDEEAGALG